MLEMTSSESPAGHTRRDIARGLGNMDPSLLLLRGKFKPEKVMVESEFTNGIQNT